MSFPARALEDRLNKLGLRIMSLAIDDEKRRVIVATNNIVRYVDLPREDSGYGLLYLHFTPRDELTWSIKEFQ